MRTAYGSGWFRERYRHSLAARGIVTRRSLALFKRDPVHKVGDLWKSPMEKSDLAKNMLAELKTNKVQEVEQKMMRYNASTTEKARVLVEYVEPIIDGYVAGRIAEQQADAQIDSKLDHNLKAHGKTETEGRGSLDFIGKAAPKGPGLFDFEGQRRAAMAGKRKTVQYMPKIELKTEVANEMNTMLDYLKKKNIEPEILREVENNKENIMAQVEHRIMGGEKSSIAKPMDVHDITFDIMYPYLSKSKKVEQ